MSKILKIGILTFSNSGKKPGLSDLMIRRAAIARGHKVQIYYSVHFEFTFELKKLNLLYRSKKFSPPDVMIIRPNMLSDVDRHLAIVKQLQLMGIPVVNNSLPIMRAKNKIRTLQILSYNGLPAPKTVVVQNVQYLDEAINQIGRFPLIMKLAQGSYGSGVSILESKRSLRSMLDLVIASKAAGNGQILIQEYVKEAKGKDIRVFIVGGKIIAAMERKAQRGEFRANFQKGGSVSLTDLTAKEKQISLKAAKVIGLDIVGVDVIRTTNGPKILEVNSNPGLEGITAVTHVDIPDCIVQFAEKRATKARKRDNLLMSG